MLEIKKITEVEKLTSVSDGATFYVEEDGKFRRADRSTIDEPVKKELATINKILGSADFSTLAPTITEGLRILQELGEAAKISASGFHNGIYRGKNLGSSVTDAQWAAIKAGTFSDMYIGDYWTVNGVMWRVAAFDYYLHAGDTECTAHHVTIIPDACLYNAQMNTENTTTGAYVGSLMRVSNLESAKSMIKSAFGSGHVLNHRNHLQNAVTDGYESGGAWYDSEVELMTEANVYGSMIFTNSCAGTSWANRYVVDRSQFPLFALDPQRMIATDRMWYWLRGAASARFFADVNGNGACGANGASRAVGVRPAFSIY